MCELWNGHKFYYYRILRPGLQPRGHEHGLYAAHKIPESGPGRYKDRAVLTRNKVLKF